VKQLITDLDPGLVFFETGEFAFVHLEDSIAAFTRVIEED
jgi:hypothetical protein